MSKYIAVIPRAAITRAALVEAGGRSMEQVKAACGCQYILNSWFYDTITGRPVGSQSGRRLERLGADLGQGRRHPPGHLTRQRRGFLPQRRGAADAHQGAG